MNTCKDCKYWNPTNRIVSNNGAVPNSPRVTLCECLYQAGMLKYSDSSVSSESHIYFGPNFGCNNFKNKT